MNYIKLLVLTFVVHTNVLSFQDQYSAKRLCLNSEEAAETIDKFDCLRRLVIWKKIEALKQCLEAETIFDVNAIKDDKGNTALHVAVVGNYVHKARLLLQHGANPLAANDAGDTPLYYLLQAGLHGKDIFPMYHVFLDNSKVEVQDKIVEQASEFLSRYELGSIKDEQQ